MRCSAPRLIVAAVALLTMSVASAHVTVSPRDSRTGAYEKYVVRVPTEGKVATTAIELEIPAGATFIAIAAAIGHTYELKKTGDKVTSVVWSMQINPGEFAEFAFMVRNPKEGGTLVWKATQRFADGTTTQWNGAAKDKHPASVTTVSAGSGEHSH
jgi:uncharacterized protein YcnI